MAKAYFISDAHLGLGQPEVEKQKEDRLLSFFNKVSTDADYLYILGDLFDTWFEYKSVIPKGFHRTIACLDELSRKNIKIHYILGNHDYWMNNFFNDELGIITHFDAFDTIIDGKKIYIHHGDGLSSNDKGYNFLKKILRSPINIFLYKLLHPDLGIALAKKMSKLSRKHSTNKQFGEEDGMKSEAGKKIEAGFDIVIMGHMHQPIFEKIKTGIYINLGDWINHYTYAEFTNGNIVLKEWKLEHSNAE